MVNSTISIIVPVYNVEQYLDRCLDSILNQTYKSIEVILVDDGSPDRCPDMCDRYAQADSRIIVIHKQNGGLSDARNTGLMLATGDYILYVDSDDYIELDACEKLLSVADDDVDFVVGYCREIRKDGIKYQRHTNIEPGRKYTPKEFVIESLKKNEWFAPAVLNLYNRDFLIRNKLFYKKGYIYEDMEMLPRLFLAAEHIVYIDYCFYNYVIRENSIMSTELSPERKRMAIDIYSNWFMLLNDVEDNHFQMCLRGALVRYYLSTVRRLKIAGWKIDGFGVGFALKYALGTKDRLKVLFFNYFPKLYINL